MTIPCQGSTNSQYKITKSGENINIEEFTKIKEFEKYYINKAGIVITTTYNNIKIIQGKLDKDGYRTVGLYTEDGIRRHRRVHRLVAETFIPNPKNLPVVNHLNGIKDDNRVANLEWTTISGNTLHGFRVLGRVPEATNNITTTLKHKTTGEILSFVSRKECGEYFGYSLTHTARLLNNRGNWEASKFRDYELIEQGVTTIM